MEKSPLRLVLLASMLWAIPGTSATAAQRPPRTLKESLQGSWIRPNGTFGIRIEGDRVLQFSTERPGVAETKGELKFVTGREYAEVTLMREDGRKGHTLYIYSAAKDVIAIEGFKEDGTLTGQGHLLYRLKE